MKTIDFASGEYTYEKVLALIHANSINLQETERLLKKESLETERRFQETERLIKEGSLETERRFQETERLIKEESLKTAKQFKATNQKIKEVGAQIGGLGNKFGSFTEGLFAPSIIKILDEKFNCKVHSKSYKFSDNGNSFEIDVLGVSKNDCFVTEIKSKFTDDAITQLIKTIEKMNAFDENTFSKTKYGIIAAMDYNEESKRKVFEAGFYFISIIDDIAKLHVPKGFIPKAFKREI